MTPQTNEIIRMIATEKKKKDRLIDPNIKSAFSLLSLLTAGRMTKT